MLIFVFSKYTLTSIYKSKALILYNLIFKATEIYDLFRFLYKKEYKIIKISISQDYKLYTYN